MKKFLYSMFFISSFAFSETIESQANSADCLILEDENSIVCKYTHERVDSDKEIQVLWIDPKGEISRDRNVVIPAGHGSIYDFRYIQGREKGTWTFKVIDAQIETTTNFELK